MLAVASSKTKQAMLTDICGSGALETIIADVSDAKQVLAYATRALELWGQIDGFVNNAGIKTKVQPIVHTLPSDSTGRRRQICSLMSVNAATSC